MTRVVLLKPNSYEVSSGEIVGLDLSSYSDPDYISVICPDFSSSIILEESYFEITSSATGEFDSNVASIAFSDSIDSEDISEGDTELKFAMSDLTNANLSSVTGVRFRIKSDETIVFKVMGIRAVSEDWNYAPIDIDTISQVIEWPVSPTGDPEFEFEFSDWPVVWQDIQPKDFAVSAEIFTGSLPVSNLFSILFRGGNVNKGIVNDLEDWNGSNQPITMDQFNSIRPELDISDEESEAFEYLGATISWEDNISSLVVEDDQDTLYSFDDLNLELNTKYMIVFLNKGDSFQVKIYQMDPDLNSIQAETFDSGLMQNHLFQPRKGYFGWHASFNDGNAYVDNIRHRHANFGDLQTRQFKGRTPVVGIQLAHTSSPPASLIKSVGSAPWGGLVSQESEEGYPVNQATYKVISNGKMEGITFSGEGGEFLISDWENTYLEFELFKAEGSYVCYLLGASGNIIELNLESSIANEWEKFSFDFDGRPDPTGRYSLVILKVASEVDTTWFVRNAKAETKTVHWVARNQEDPWDMVPEDWLPFSETSNKANSGIMFREPGYPQVKASITNNESFISEFHVIPKYAELGRIVTDADLAPINHMLEIATDVNDLRVDFGAQITYVEGDDRRPIGYIWIFDSTNEWSTGSAARKVFRTPGDHQAFLQVTYNDGSVQSQTWRGTLTS